MKRQLTFLLFAVCTAFTHAQTFPLPGATWFFTADNSAGNPYAERLEYLGDSVVPNGIIKKMRLTEKLVNPSWYTQGDTTYVFSGMVYYRYSGDSVYRIVSSGEDFVCNFSLVVGDSSYTPYYNETNLQWLNIPGDAYFCSQADTAFVHQNGVVTAAGTQTADGVTYRYYTLTYTDEDGNPDSVTFSERSIITEDYWYRTALHMCGTSTDPVIAYLLCFSDDSTAVPCAEEDWFAQLGVADPAFSWNGGLYPNPATHAATISNPASFPVKVYLTDLRGRMAGSNFEVGANSSAAIDLSALGSGTYIVSLEANGGLIRKRLVVLNP